MRRPDKSWMADGACRDHDTLLFYPSNGDFSAASAICAACPVRLQCLEYALEWNERLGIWGGVSERGRMRMQQARRAARSQPSDRPLLGATS